MTIIKILCLALIAIFVAVGLGVSQYPYSSGYWGPTNAYWHAQDAGFYGATSYHYIYSPWGAWGVF